MPVPRTWHLLLRARRDVAEIGRTLGVEDPARPALRVSALAGGLRLVARTQ